MSFTSGQIEVFNKEVLLKYQLFNSLFTSLPFQKIEKTGILLSLLVTYCEEGYAKGNSPKEIIDHFFRTQTDYIGEKDRLDLLFRFIQYGERQVVLFDALEDAAFALTHDLEGIGTLKQIETETRVKALTGELADRLREFAVRLVLTAHPTQFYPDSVLGIIHELAQCIATNQITEINLLLQQLGKTPFFKHTRPSPVDEANSLIWYLKKIFYPAIGRINQRVIGMIPETAREQDPLIHLGFWPGGDRDGNPFVTWQTTVEVAGNLRSNLLQCYLDDIRDLKKRLTFKNVDVLIARLEKMILQLAGTNGNVVSKEKILDLLFQVRNIITNEHDSLFLENVDAFIAKVQSFGFYFASLDIRQDSSVHQSVVQAILPFTDHSNVDYPALDEAQKNRFLTTQADLHPDFHLEPGSLEEDTILTIRAMKSIQEQNGELACHRYILSQCESVSHILEAFFLIRTTWAQPQISVDIVPLFEKIDDLKLASQIMSQLYRDPVYREHLKSRSDFQTIMLGFSDGTKDGGYLMANWSIYQAKENLTAVSKEFGIKVIFFDGRGGPPSRGGGKTHKFYASLGHRISNTEIQLTIQGQTVSSSFGTIASAQYNIEQLLNAGIYNDVLADHTNTLNPDHRQLIDEMATTGMEAFRSLKSHPRFMSYLSTVSPLNYYSETNIASRPSKRGKSKDLRLEDLRAIPFVGSWSQNKQNVPGFFGVGSALEKMYLAGKWDQVRDLYQSSLFFKTLIENNEMAMKKSFFPLTAYLETDAEFAGLFRIIYDEFKRTQKYVLLLTGHKFLMEDYPADSISVDMRERIVRPLLTIQQFALMQLRKPEYQDHELRPVYEKLVIRSSFGIINAARNSV
ncbi:MAG TPA: phosphoenolpyruvate carboxylase [Saprospiraceae bacterium]|nr:phosphoenolpyruvate carboxylase [Saprospiraceae bacterium]HNR07520.1 phosphoenolpyruvate carboxylase [Saprospiraceae bacterium]HNT21743.1 phosphoenolpyruvate carboxylase [Saprospiraceae bacterium]